MRRQRNAKIVVTLGPSSSDKSTIKALFDAGADVFRLNLSHGKHGEHKARLDAIREIESDSGRPIGVLADLRGPKFRVGQFRKGPIELRNGERFRLDLDATPGDSQRVCLPHPEIFQALKPEAKLLINDGRVGLRVEDCGGDFADCSVFAGGEVSNNKGVNIPDVQLPLSPLTKNDREDRTYALELGVDSEKPEDVEELRGIVSDRAGIIFSDDRRVTPAGYTAIRYCSYRAAETGHGTGSNHGQSEGGKRRYRKTVGAGWRQSGRTPALVSGFVAAAIISLRGPFSDRLLGLFAIPGDKKRKAACVLRWFENLAWFGWLYEYALSMFESSNLKLLHEEHLQ